MTRRSSSQRVRAFCGCRRRRDPATLRGDQRSRIALTLALSQRERGRIGTLTLSQRERGHALTLALSQGERGRRGGPPPISRRLRMPGQFPQLPVDGLKIGGGDLGPGDGEVERGRDDQVARRPDAEEPLDQGVGHLVVLRPADAVQEEVAKHEPGEERGHHRPGAEPHRSGGQFGQGVGRRPEVAVAGQRHGHFRPLAVAQQQFPATAAGEEPAARGSSCVQIQ